MPIGRTLQPRQCNGKKMEQKQIQKQVPFLQKAQKTLYFNAKQIAAALFVDYDTYGKWRR